MQTTTKAGQPRDLSNERGTGTVDKIRRDAYLSQRGINPRTPIQLGLEFAGLASNDLRSIPNDYARCALFSARSRKVPRRTLTHEKLFHLHEGQGVSILYTGIELRAEDDELVWLQIMHYASQVPLGEPFEFSLRELVRDVGWTKSGPNYRHARECISRLRGNEVLALNEKAYGKSGSISLIANYTTLNDADGNPAQYRVWIDPNIVVLFAGNTFTTHNWTSWRALSPVARRLADYVESHKNPFPLDARRFASVCGSMDARMKSWRETVKRACKELEKHGVARQVFLQDDMIYTVPL